MVGPDMVSPDMVPCGSGARRLSAKLDRMECISAHQCGQASERWIAFHDLSHLAITELAESQASDQTIMVIAGHVSPQDAGHDAHVRLEPKRTALNALSRRTPSVGIERTVRSQVTSQTES